MLDIVFLGSLFILMVILVLFIKLCEKQIENKKE
jgi:hypothetical protein